MKAATLRPGSRSWGHPLWLLRPVQWAPRDRSPHTGSSPPGSGPPGSWSCPASPGPSRASKAPARSWRQSSPEDGAPVTAPGPSGEGSLPCGPSEPCAVSGLLALAAVSPCHRKLCLAGGRQPGRGLLLAGGCLGVAWGRKGSGSPWRRGAAQGLPPAGGSAYPPRLRLLPPPQEPRAPSAPWPPPSSP